MDRLKMALALMLCVILALAVPTAAEAAPADQPGWASLKKQVRLGNGLTVAYVELGNPKGAPLLLLHGYTDSSRSFSLMAPALAGYRLLIPDQRGHGASDKPDCCYSLSQLADDARLFLDSMKVERAAVAGHSLGSMVAITLAADHPGRVAQLVLIGSTALVPVKPGDWLYDNALALEAPLDPGSDFMKEWHPANQPTPVDPVFAEAVRQEYLTIPLHVWHAIPRELAMVPVGRHAADIDTPVLILSGGKDPIFPAEHHASLLRAFPDARAIVFPDLGHNPNWERPDLVAQAIDAFLRSHPNEGQDP